MPYICQTRTDIPDGVLQVLDLRPNTSQRNLIYEPAGQTKYVNRTVNDSVATTGAGPISTRAAYTGLAAYLIDHVEKGGLAAGLTALTAANANTIAAAIIARMDAGLSMTLANVNTLIAATAANSELTSAGGSASTGSLADVLRILAGGEYILPVGSVVEDGANHFVTTVSGAFTTGQYRPTYQTGSLEISLGEGHLAELSDANWEYRGATGAAVVVYDDDGSLKS